METTQRYAYCIQEPRDSTGENHSGHITHRTMDRTMPRWTMCGDGLLPESPIRVSVRQISDIEPGHTPHVESHCHDVDKLYIFLSHGAEQLTASVFLDYEEYTVRSPVTIYIPKGVPHRYYPTGGRGTLIMIMNMSCRENYNDHTYRPGTVK